MKSQTASISVLWLILIIVLIGAGAYFLGTRQTKTVQPASVSVIKTAVASPTPIANAIEAKIVAGDVVVTKNGQETKITDWGHNFSPVLSPDQTKVAYTSQTAQALEDIKNKVVYSGGETNAWIINTDGTNPIQVTTHQRMIFRGNLRWLDNNRLLFTDGTESAKVFDLKSKLTTNVLGPNTPTPWCPDACGGGTYFVYSPDNHYLILMGLGGGGIASIPQSTILDLQTLKTQKIQIEEVVMDNMNFQFPNYHTMTFEGRIKDSINTAGSKDFGNLKNFTVDLITGKVQISQL